jgi:adenylate cyclase
VLPALLQVSLSGFVASSAMILWAIFSSLAALALQGLRRSVVWFVAFFAVLVVVALLDPRLSQDPAELPTGFVLTFFVLNVMGLTLSAYVMPWGISWNSGSGRIVRSGRSGSGRSGSC